MNEFAVSKKFRNRDKSLNALYDNGFPVARPAIVGMEMEAELLKETS